MKLLLFLLALAPSLAFGFTLTPPQDQWVKKGEQATLLCRSSEPVRSCIWNTPYNQTYVLFAGLKAESGRLQHFSEDEDSDCGIIISKVDESDSGIWKCTVGVVKVHISKL